MKKTKIFHWDLHIELWDWLSKNPNKNKHEWPRWKNNGGDVKISYNNCFACQACNHVCSMCPFGDFSRKGCLGRLYDKWYTAKTNKKRIKYAEIIRDLPLGDKWEQI